MDNKENEKVRKKGNMKNRNLIVTHLFLRLLCVYCFFIRFLIDLYIYVYKYLSIQYWIPRAELLDCFTKKIENSKNIKILYSHSCEDIKINSEGVVEISVCKLENSSDIDYTNDSNDKNKDSKEVHRGSNNDNSNNGIKNNENKDESDKNDDENDKNLENKNSILNVITVPVYTCLKPSLLLGCDGLNSNVRNFLEKTENKKNENDKNEINKKNKNKNIMNKYTPVTVPSAAAGLKYKMLTLKNR